MFSNSIKIKCNEHKRIMNGIVKEFIKSKDMAEYLVTKEIDPLTVIDIINLSVEPVDKKISALERIKAIDDKETIERCNLCLAYYKKAEKIMSQDGVFSLVVCGYKDEQYYEWFAGIFSTYEAAFEFVLGEDDTKNEECIWYEVNKWTKGLTGDFDQECKYYIFNNQVIMVELDDADFGLELNLPVPFKQGEVVHISGLPFNPDITVLILSVGDNRDCCCLQGMYRDKNTGKWVASAIKHSFFWDNYPMVSPLYSMQRIELDIKSSDYAVLNKVREYIQSKQEITADILWQKLSISGLTDDEIYKLISR